MGFKIKNVDKIVMYSIIVVVAILAYFLISNFSLLMDKAMAVLGILQPFFVGIILAYILNLPMSFLEKKVIGRYIIKNEKYARVRRIVSALLTIVLVFSVLLTILLILIPQVKDSVTTFTATLPEKINILQNDIINTLTAFHISSDQVPQILSVESITRGIVASSSWITMFFSAIISGFTTTIIGIVLCVYFLIDKERFSVQLKKIMYAFFDREKVDKFLTVVSVTNETFINYLSGILFDALIVATMCFFGMLFIAPQFALLISVIIGLSNLIPFFGPIIGCVPTGLLILLTVPEKIVWFLMFILIMQQIDANVIGPRILGKSTGLPVHWVIFAILVGGGMFGFVGMVFGVPVFAVIHLLFKAFIDQKYKKKNNLT